MRLLALTFCLTACVAERVVIDPKWNALRPPDHVDYYDQWAFWLIGQPRVDAPRACLDRKVRAFERRRSFEDGVITAFTLGVYSPSTALVWCD